MTVGTGPRRRWARLALAGVLMAAAGLSGPPAAAVTEEELFRQVFGGGGGSDPDAPLELTLPVWFNGAQIGEVTAQPQEGEDQIRIAAAPLLALLQERLRPETGQALAEALPAGAAYVPVTAIAADGVSLRFDDAELALDVTVRPELMRTVEIDLAGRPDFRTNGPTMGPAFFSAYSNVQVAMDYVASSTGNAHTNGRQPLQMAFDNAVRLDDWVLESALTYDEDLTPRWSRGDLRLVRDFPDQGIRSIAGDTYLPITGFQGSRPVAGLAVARNFALQPYRNVQPAGRGQFILTGPSTVELAVNGRPLRSYRLPAGSYDLNNFPGTSGTNDATIRITDEAGQQTDVVVPFFVDRQLLAEDIHEFAYAVGLQRSFRNNRMHYQPDTITASGLHRFGLTDWITLGVNSQADRLQKQMGTEVTVGTPFGIFTAEPAVSFGSTIPLDGAFTFDFRHYKTGDSHWEPTVAVTAQYQGRRFASLGTLEPDVSVALDTAARLSFDLDQRMELSFGGRYRLTRDEDRYDALGLDAGLRVSLWSGTSLSLDLSNSRDADGRHETVAYLSLRTSFDGGRHSVSASYGSAERDRRLAWRYQSPGVVDSLSGGIELGKSSSERSLDGDLAYTHQRFKTSVRSTTAQTSLSDTRSTEQRASFVAATALVFADGHVGVARPVSDSFAVIVPHPRFRDRTIGVDQTAESFLAESDWLGPPVVPNLNAYHLRALRIDLPDLPVGLDPGDDRFALLPGYRSGIAVPVGSDATVSLTGLVRDPGGAPVALTGGSAARQDSPADEELLFFTNRDGRFRVEGLAPGTWTLTLFGHAGGREVVVPAGAEGTLDIGVITP